MKQYSEIKYFHKDYTGLKAVAFDKMDGSNLRFEYSQSQGFYKFGTRNTMINRDSAQFGFSVDIFLNKYNDSLTKIFRGPQYRSIQSFVCFAELFGTKSEFGFHDFNNDVFDIVLFDVSEYKKGLILPDRFIGDFGHTGIPRIIKVCNLDDDFVQSIKDNEYDLREGVVCKGLTNTKKGKDSLYYCKIKTDEWFDRLRRRDLEKYIDEYKQSHGR